MACLKFLYENAILPKNLITSTQHVCIKKDMMTSEVDQKIWNLLVIIILMPTHMLKLI